ncbi:hypothetical protein GGI43DRAFT_210946 [Trichoderma evansii]
MIPNKTTQSPNGDAISVEVIPDMTISEIRQARRKVQNRVNQRAFRSRAREKKAADGSMAYPYRVHRWRIDDGSDALPPLKPKGETQDAEAKSAPSDQLPHEDHPADAGEPPNSDEIHSHHTLASIPAATSADKRSSPWFNLRYCLLSEHLLHLIHFNVLRGLSYNKKVLRPTAFLECSGTPSIPLKRILPHMPDDSLLVALRLPENLTPTSLQLSRPHSNWIDVFPFPAMRDNLIRYENYFSHAEFLTDLLGNLINCMGGACDLPPGRANTLPGSKGYDDGPDRQGMILWGEPYQRDSWEVTPGFLRKWLWVMKGCGELIESTNKWRTARGERPLRVALSQ